MKNLPLSASGRLRAYFSTKLYKIPFYRPSADWGLIFNKIKRKIRNLLISAFGRFEAHFPTKLNAKYKMSLYRPPADWGLFFHKIRLKYKIPCHRPSAKSRLILQQNNIQNIISFVIGFRPIGDSFLTKLNIISSFIGLRPIGNLFFNKIKLKNPFTSAFGRFEAHFTTQKIKNIKSFFIGLRPIGDSFLKKIKYKI